MIANIIHQHNYVELSEMGFEREYLKDHVYMDQHGYDDFVMRYMLQSNDVIELFLDFSHKERTVDLVSLSLVNGSYVTVVKNLDRKQIEGFIKTFLLIKNNAE